MIEPVTNHGHGDILTREILTRDGLGQDVLQKIDDLGLLFRRDGIHEVVGAFFGQHRVVWKVFANGPAEDGLRAKVGDGDGFAPGFFGSDDQRLAHAASQSGGLLYGMEDVFSFVLPTF